MRKQQLARDRREAGYRARAQTSQSPREPRTQVPSASRNERREDDPCGGAERALYKARALAAKARREAKQALATKARADQAELNLRIKEREVEAHNARLKERKERKERLDNLLTPEQTRAKARRDYAHDRVARAESMGHGAAYEKFKSGYRAITPAKPHGLLANAKLGLQIAARDFATALEKGTTGALYTQCNQKLDKAFAWYQDLVTQERLNEMMPGKATSEGYALRQVAEATRKAEIQAKWFYNQGITEDPAIQPLDYPKSVTLLGNLKRLAEARYADTADKSVRDRKNEALKQYTQCLIPFLIKRMVDTASAGKAETEAPTPAPVEHGNNPVATPAASSMSAAEAEAYAAELSAQEAERDARAAVFTEPSLREEATRRRVHDTQLAKAKAFIAWSGAHDPHRVAPRRLKHETDAQYT